MKCLTSVCPLCGWPGLRPGKLDQRDQQDAGQQQLGAAEGKHGARCSVIYWDFDFDRPEKRRRKSDVPERLQRLLSFPSARAKDSELCFANFRPSDANIPQWPLSVD